MCQTNRPVQTQMTHSVVTVGVVICQTFQPQACYMLSCVVMMHSNGRQFESLIVDRCDCDNSLIPCVYALRLHVEDLNRESTCALSEQHASGTHAPKC